VDSFDGFPDMGTNVAVGDLSVCTQEVQNIRPGIWAGEFAFNGSCEPAADFFEDKRHGIM
jgi:hypothetical protein